MQKIFVVFFLTWACFIVQGVAVRLLGPWFPVNLLIILIVFFNLFRGVRYALLTALVGGLLMDSFSPRTFGVNTFSFLVSAYLASFLKMAIYQSGSGASRVLMVFLLASINAAIQYILHIMTLGIAFGAAFWAVFVPEVFSTTLVSAYVMERIKRCALRFFA